MEGLGVLVPDQADVEDEVMVGMNDQMQDAWRRMSKKPISLWEFGYIA